MSGTRKTSGTHWSDVLRVADRVLTRPGDKPHPHFLGAVVLQQVQKQTGQMQERTIIDGQQRLTTLQLRWMPYTGSCWQLVVSRQVVEIRAQLS